MGEFYELRNFMNAWSQQQQEEEQEELHESSANRLYECKPVKNTLVPTPVFYQTQELGYVHKGYSVFIQTDKSVYRPGNAVKFRAVVVTPQQLKPSVVGKTSKHSMLAWKWS